MTNFLKAFKERIKALETTGNGHRNDDNVIQDVQPLYDIMRCTLPYGMNRVVMFGVSRDEAKELIKTRLKTTIKDNVVTYYDYFISNK